MPQFIRPELSDGASVVSQVHQWQCPQSLHVDHIALHWGVRYPKCCGWASWNQWHCSARHRSVRPAAAAGHACPIDMPRELVKFRAVLRARLPTFSTQALSSARCCTWCGLTAPGILWKMLAITGWTVSRLRLSCTIRSCNIWFYWLTRGARPALIGSRYAENTMIGISKY